MRRHQTSHKILLRKEVIQPQVPLRLPCYDFTPITGHTLGTYLPAPNSMLQLISSRDTVFKNNIFNSAITEAKS